MMRRLTHLTLVGFLALATSCLEGGQGPLDPLDGPLAGGVGDGEIGRGGSDGDGGDRGSGGVAEGDPAASMGGDDGGGSSSSSGSGTSELEPGTLTAGAWDDNRNFDFFADYRAGLIDSLTGALPIESAEHLAANELAEATGDEAHSTLDIALVIDTTGSMADEIAYLQTEFLALSEAIEAAYPGSQQRWALVVYRDVGDEYLIRWFEFRESAEEFRVNLAAQNASGGGDYPEAPDQALKLMNRFAWRTDNATARLAFWVADAPHHDENAEELAMAIRESQALDIHIYPVASSGVDGLTELSMRSAAQLTGGRYLFLTDDSGVGGSHMEPTLPCYFVTKLDDAILRMVDIEISGLYREPQASEVIRTGGDPQDGACQLDSGEVVEIY